MMQQLLLQGQDRAALARSRSRSMAPGPASFTHTQLVQQDYLLTEPGPIREGL